VNPLPTLLLVWGLIVYFSDIVNRGTTPALEKLLAFTQARHQVVTENIANIDTPGYQARHLDGKAFQETLRKALDTRKKTQAPEFTFRATRQAHLDRAGHLVATPSERPAENIMFHDQTNVRVEKQMATLAENAMVHQAVTELLHGRYQGLIKAIRGRIT